MSASSKRTTQAIRGLEELLALLTMAHGTPLMWNISGRVVGTRHGPMANQSLLRLLLPDLKAVKEVQGVMARKACRDSVLRVCKETLDSKGHKGKSELVIRDPKEVRGSQVVYKVTKAMSGLKAMTEPERLACRVIKVTSGVTVNRDPLACKGLGFRVIKVILACKAVKGLHRLDRKGVKESTASELLVRKVPKGQAKSVCKGVKAVSAIPEVKVFKDSGHKDYKAMSGSKEVKEASESATRVRREVRGSQVEYRDTKVISAHRALA